MKPAANTPIKIWRSQRKITPRPNSSMANTTPAKGALNAAAKPPAAPAAIKSFSCMPLNASPCFLHHAPQAFMTAAPTCTDGPSLPIDAPKIMPKNVSGILKKVSPRRIKRVFCAPYGKDKEAMTCGIPLPEVYGANLRVNHAKSGKPSGKATHANHGYLPTNKAFHSKAKSAKRANSKAVRATSAEPASKNRKAMLFFDRRLVWRILWARRAAQVCGNFIIGMQSMCSDGLDTFLKGRLKTRIKVFKNGNPR